METLPTTAPPTTDLLRSSLIARVRAAAPSIVSIVAPAGFGKTTLARQLLATLGGNVAVCDCSGAGSDVELVRRVLPALAEEAPERSATLAMNESLLGEGHGSAADRVAKALTAWRVPPPQPSAFVFENTEHAIADAGAREVLARLLAGRPERRMVVICSREPLRMHVSRFAPPHRILSLRAADLAFDESEIAAIFAAGEVTPETMARVAAVSAGWPIAVLLLARFAQEHRLDELLEKLDDVAYEELHEYLADQVLGSVPPAVIDGLLVSAALPRATEGEVRLAVSDELGREAFAAFAKSSPFVTRAAGGVVTAHPLVASTLLERHPARVDALLGPIAGAALAASDYERAAEVELARGDPEAAAAALEHVEVIEADAPTITYARLLASFERATVMRYPRLWAVTALLRTFAADAHALLGEVESVWARLPADSPPALRIYLYVFRVLMLSYVGEFETALALVDEFRAQIGAPDEPSTRMHGWLLYLRSLMTARLGRLREAERDLEAAWPFVSAMTVMAGGTQLTLGADIARVRGDRATERERLARAIEYARATGFGNFIAFYEAEATLGAWLAGDDAAYEHHGFALETAVDRDAVHGFAFFTACVRGRTGATEPSDFKKWSATGYLKWVACGYLVAAARTADRGAALRNADTAREAAAGYRAPFYQVLAALAVAELNPAKRVAMRGEAAAIAKRIDAPELHKAVDALARGEDAGFLEPFVRRYRGAGEAAPRAGLVVELVNGRVLIDDNPVMLAEREHALLAAVAMRPEGLSRERLTDLLWPDLGEKEARNAFHVCLHRLKTRLGHENVVVRAGDSYRVGGDVRVDLWEIDRALAGVRASDAADPARTAALREVYQRLRAERPAKFEAWEWFEPTERHLRELRCEVAQVLAKEALDDRRYADALTLCHEMSAYDPCDEPAREIAIRAYLASDDRAAALRHFRQYRDVLMAELQCEPSAALAKLVGATS